MKSGYYCPQGNYFSTFKKLQQSKTKIGYFLTNYISDTYLKNFAASYLLNKNKKQNFVNYLQKNEFSTEQIVTIEFN